MSDRTDNPTRVFLDANVLYVAVVGGGCVKLWSIGGLQLVTSEYAMDEVRQNLMRDRTVDFASAVSKLADLASPPMELAAASEATVRRLATLNLPDSTDVPILAAAIESRCAYLLTADGKCFGRYFGKTLEGIHILRPGKFLGILGH